MHGICGSCSWIVWQRSRWDKLGKSVGSGDAKTGDQN